MRRMETPEERIISTMNASEQSTKSMLSILAQTKVIGTQTLAELQAQGDKLQAAQNDVDTIAVQQKVAKRKVRSIASIFWDIINYFLPNPSRKNHNLEVDKQIAKEKSKIKKPKTKKNQDKMSTDVIADALKNNPAADKYRETDKMLDEVESGVKDLHAIAVEMGEEIGTHNKRLDTLVDTTTDVRAETKSLGGRVRGITLSLE